jgi:hypothetical protein
MAFGVMAVTGVKGKVFLVLSMPWRHVWGAEIYLHSFLTLALVGGE